MISVEVVEGCTAPMQVLANHDHFRDMNRMFWEWRATGVYTDLELICQVRGVISLLVVRVFVIIYCKNVFTFKVYRYCT
jgi:hypothetical protein